MLAYILARILYFIMGLFNVDFYDSVEDDDEGLYGILEDDENSNDDPDRYSQQFADYNGNYCFQSNQS